jgi:serum/glucocorticoid-regulated kinase 2
MLSKEMMVKNNEIPKQWSSEAADFFNKLLKRSSADRLGKGGIDEIKNHAWLKDINWNALLKKEVPSPYIPKVKSTINTKLKLTPIGWR